VFLGICQWHLILLHHVRYHLHPPHRQTD
jgi:hypothetical protein